MKQINDVNMCKQVFLYLTFKYFDTCITGYKHWVSVQVNANDWWFTINFQMVDSLQLVYHMFIFIKTEDDEVNDLEMAIYF